MSRAIGGSSALGRRGTGCAEGDARIGGNNKIFRFDLRAIAYTHIGLQLCNARRV